MPLTKKGKEIMRSMKEQYGPDRGEEVFYASRNKGVIKDVERKAGGGTVAAKKKFPDLTGDGKVTKADILKGRGVEGFEKGGKVKVERVNEKGRTEAVEKALKALGAMKQGDIQAKYPTKGKRDDRRPKHRDPGADDRMKEFERSLREAGFKDGGSVCAGGRSAIAGKKFSGTY